MILVTIEFVPHSSEYSKSSDFSRMWCYQPAEYKGFMTAVNES
jgi:hypothetical protein